MLNIWIYIATEEPQPMRKLWFFRLRTILVQNLRKTNILGNYGKSRLFLNVIMIIDIMVNTDYFKLHLCEQSGQSDHCSYERGEQ